MIRITIDVFHNCEVTIAEEVERIIRSWAETEPKIGVDHYELLKFSYREDNEPHKIKKEK